MNGGGDSTGMKKARGKSTGSEVDKSGGIGNNGPAEVKQEAQHNMGTGEVRHIRTGVRRGKDVGQEAEEVRFKTWKGWCGVEGVGLLGCWGVSASR